MNTEDQSDVIAFLEAQARDRDPAAERIDTHGAHLFISGDEAWKLKRAVWYPFMDLSDSAKRRDCCVAEVDLNRRTAPDLYLGVAAVTRDSAGALAIDGEGTPVDWFVRMRRFDQSGLLDRLADAGALPHDLMPRLAEAIASFHAAARPRPDRGGAEAMRWIVDDNVAEFREMGGLVDSAAVEALAAASGEQLGRVAALLEARRAAGWVRRCHGDLHLRNVVLIEGRPTLFDCIEFSEEIACVDVLYDLAFMLMDLWKRGLAGHANSLFNAYLAACDQRGGLATLPLFLSARASVRAKVAGLAAMADGGGTDAAAGIMADVEAAVRFATPGQPRLVAVGGLSGSGKTTLAHALAPEIGPAPGAVVLRSDIERKRMLGAAPDERLPESGYAPEVSKRVYGLLMDLAASCLAQGHGAVVDAVFDRPADRAAVAQVAADLGLPFTGFWLDAPEATLIARVKARRGDASDATASVIRSQLAADTGEITWVRLAAGRGPERVAADARRSLVEMLA
ncbi:MAG: AAA family ATPase [Alphaproteobacteria bacterium]